LELFFDLLTSLSALDRSFFVSDSSLLVRETLLFVLLLLLFVSASSGFVLNLLFFGLAFGETLSRASAAAGGISSGPSSEP
jgi:hypothetical protein